MCSWEIMRKVRISLKRPRSTAKNSTNLLDVLFPSKYAVFVPLTDILISYFLMHLPMNAAYVFSGS